MTESDLDEPLDAPARGERLPAMMREWAVRLVARARDAQGRSRLRHRATMSPEIR